ncbi:MAG: hypothetical protein ACRDL1_00070 [Solirubrobacterales bacterium]
MSLFAGLVERRLDVVADRQRQGRRRRDDAGEPDHGAETGALTGVAEREDGHALDEDEVWYVADAIPNDTVAAIALLEHRWAIPLRDSILEAGGTVLSDAWVHPSDLVAIGMVAAESEG